MTPLKERPANHPAEPSPHHPKRARLDSNASVLATTIQDLGLTTPPPISVAEMAAIAHAGSPRLDREVGGDPFQSYLLGLLSQISQHPSPSFPFPDNGSRTASPTNTAVLTPFSGPKSDAEEAIERAVILLGQRAWDAERVASALKQETMAPAQPTQRPGTALPTPEWTPPIHHDVSTTNVHICPTCAQPFPDLTPTGMRPQNTTASLPLSVSLSTPASQFGTNRHASSATSVPPHSILTTQSGASVLTGGPHATGWRGGSNTSGMSAEKELELLKAQVQDIARVCKVRRRSLFPQQR